MTWAKIATGSRPGGGPVNAALKLFATNLARSLGAATADAEVAIDHSAWILELLEDADAQAFLGQCESPVELLFAGGLVWLARENRRDAEFCGSKPGRPLLHADSIDFTHDDCSCVGDKCDGWCGPFLLIRPQVALASARHDFVVSSPQADGPVGVLVVEIDGHGFHDRTKEQASADRRRDRNTIRAHSMPTIRFTGSDVYRDPIGCAREAREIAGLVHGRSVRAACAAWDAALVRAAERAPAAQEAAE